MLLLKKPYKEENQVTLRSLFVLVLAALFPVSAYCQESKPTHLPPLVFALRLPPALDFCGESVPLERREVRERLEKELLLSAWDRPQVILWLKRIPRYMSLIEGMLKEGNMPDDLKYIAIAESALRPHVSSKRGAIGFWQFMTDTGQRYGLTINRHLDERRNLITSTQAAILYFNDLHDRFGSWTLAAAAYNMGEQGLMAEIFEQGVNDYYQLYLPIETQRFIFRILSVKLIVTNPEQYGFHLSGADLYPPLEFDEIQLTCSEETPIRIIAQAAQAHFKAIKDLNPEIRGHFLPQGTHVIRVPKGSTGDFHSRYRELLQKWGGSKSETVYIVKKGDNLSLIADRFNVPLASLLIWNKLNLKSAIYPGDRLIIYWQEEPRETDEVLKGEEEENL
jgi:membrane-bound lytic murein transglycosylase D